MQSPATPENEQERLESLKSLMLLDTQPEEQFDRITRIAEALFGVGIALVSLVDTDRQWFKSKQGLDAEETGRDISFCGHAILDDEDFVIEDALEDERFRDNPLVTGAPYIRFYAGAPINSPSGHKIGTLCVIDQNPKVFTQKQKMYLRDLARMVEDELLLRDQSSHDPLTGLSNRVGFSIRAEQVLAVARRNGLQLSLACFDLDDYDKVRETWGEDAGKQMLQTFADVLNESFRTSDVVARVGDNEFAVLMAGAELDNRAAVQRLSDAANGASDSVKGGLRWSVGVIDYDFDVHNGIDDLMLAADHYIESERTSRNRI